MLVTLKYDIPTLNAQLSGTGYQVRSTKTKLRVENECGEFLFYRRNIQHFLNWWMKNVESSEHRFQSAAI